MTDTNDDREAIRIIAEDERSASLGAELGQALADLYAVQTGEPRPAVAVEVRLTDEAARARAEQWQHGEDDPNLFAWVRSKLADIKDDAEAGLISRGRRLAVADVAAALRIGQAKAWDLCTAAER